VLGYKSATGHSVWLVRLPETVSPLTFVPHLHYQLSKTRSRKIVSYVPTSLTVSQSTSSVHSTAPLQWLVILLCLMSCPLYYYYYYYFIIISWSITHPCLRCRLYPRWCKHLALTGPTANRRTAPAERGDEDTASEGADTVDVGASTAAKTVFSASPSTCTEAPSTVAVLTAVCAFRSKLLHFQHSSSPFNL